MHACAKREGAGDNARDTYLTVYFDDLAFEPPVEAPRAVGAQVAQWSQETFETAVQDVQVLTHETLDIIQRNVNAGFGSLRKLAGAKDLAEVLDLQAAYWRNQFAAFMGQIEELSALSTKVAADIIRGSASREGQ